MLIRTKSKHFWLIRGVFLVGLIVRRHNQDLDHLIIAKIEKLYKTYLKAPSLHCI